MHCIVFQMWISCPPVHKLPKNIVKTTIIQMALLLSKRVIVQMFQTHFLMKYTLQTFSICLLYTCPKVTDRNEIQMSHCQTVTRLCHTLDIIAPAVCSLSAIQDLCQIYDILIPLPYQVKAAYLPFVCQSS